MIDSKYNPREIEESAQNYWEDKRVFESIEDQEKEKILLSLHVSIPEWTIAYGTC